jgi:hypothetical protein
LDEGLWGDGQGIGGRPSEQRLSERLIGVFSKMDLRGILE